jgi:DNA polymerase I-like protein with 3'-5' exonuclease and polymerase domains
LLTPDNEVDIVTSNLPMLMTNGINLGVQLAIDIKTAQNWDEAH